METQTSPPVGVTPRSTGIRFGLVGALVSIAYFLILNLTGADVMGGVWSWLGYAITAVLLVFAHQFYKKKGDGYMTYGQGIGIAFWYGLISGSISGVFNYLYIKFIDTGFIELVRQRQIEQLQQQGFSDEQIDRVVEVSSMFMSAEAMLLFMVFGVLLSSIIIGLIVTIFTQKKNPEPAF